MSTFKIASIALFVVTAIPTMTALWWYRSQPRNGMGALFCALTLFSAFVSLIAMAILPPLLLIPLILAVVFLFCRARGIASRKARSLIVSAAFAMDLGFLSWWGGIAWGLNEQLRKYPLISLSDRLEYERDVRATLDFSPFQYAPGFLASPDRINQSSLPIAKNVSLTNLHRLEEEIYDAAQRDAAFRRYRTLSSLLHAHHNTELQFIMSAGFGRMRTFDMPYRYWRLDLPESPLLPLEHPQDRPSITAPDEWLLTQGKQYQPWHEQNLILFLSPRTLGLVGFENMQNRPDLSQVVGFQEHAFRSKIEPPSRIAETDGHWKFDVVSLVSLLKHRPAAVYLSDNLPNMKELATAQTRRLDDFETSALEQLDRGEELIACGGTDQIRMVGAIRAAFQCLECHQVPRGTLLGAFSYRLSRSSDDSSERSEPIILSGH